ncbi:hypothetical protein BDV96DRAFT_627296 [Lophiotrema nucula]|uniref:BTB domain-containing protein n=1 Tax=Lophiotrema nucula TaxID=690887 RepID=A0A6A5ZRP1_9PLEO|nr:hypothetical protein BDV96DRAFT_627296 [Lophiotrema nucula]
MSTPQTPAKAPEITNVSVSGVAGGTTTSTHTGADEAPGLDSKTKPSSAAAGDAASTGRSISTHVFGQANQTKPLFSITSPNPGTKPFATSGARLDVSAPPMSAPRAMQDSTEHHFATPTETFGSKLFGPTQNALVSTGAAFRPVPAIAGNDHLLSFGLGIFCINVQDAEKKKQFKIHADLVSQRSSFFCSKLSDETSTPDVVIDINTYIMGFDLYMQLIYGGLSMSHIGQICHDEVMVGLAKLYAVGVAVKDFEAQDVATEAIRNRSNTFDKGMRDIPDGEAITILYNHSNESSGARRLVLDLYAFRHEAIEFIKDKKGTFPKAFLDNLLTKALEVRTATKFQDPTTADHTSYREVDPAIEDEDDDGGA